MSEILKVLNRKSVELKSEVVELNIVKDLDAANNKIKNALGDAQRVYDNMYSRRNEVEQAINEINMLKSDFRDSEGKLANVGGALQDLEKLSDKLESSAKELGIDPMEVKGVKEALSLQEQGSKLMKELNAEQKRTDKTLSKLK